MYLFAMFFFPQMILLIYAVNKTETYKASSYSREYYYTTMVILTLQPHFC